MRGDSTPPRADEFRYDVDAQWEQVPFVIHNVETVARPGEPFNACTNLAVNYAGRVYVADGYGNCRIHVFSPDGELLRSWGEVGVGPGEFHLPHGIGVGPDDRVYVCDRENDRVQHVDGSASCLRRS